MPAHPMGVDYLIGLYNGHQSVAERVTPAQLQYIHVKTALDDKIRAWLLDGWDVILTGNPGDGKTHILSYLVLPSEVVQEKDASQKHPQAILQAWLAAKRAKKPFILAVNHAPLRRLAEIALDSPDFAYLHEMILPTHKRQSAIDNFVVYSDEQESAQNDQPPGHPRIKLIDLSQREILTEEIIAQLLDRLCPLADQDSCASLLGAQCNRCPLHENAKTLSYSQVQHNLAFILSLVARRGFHATMRDLVGLLAFALTGGETCNQLWRKEGTTDAADHDKYDYYNLLFAGRNLLFDALRRTFDPGQLADPRVDLQLWSGEVTEGWTVSNTPGRISPPSSLSGLRSLKRRYFFEHNEPIREKCRRMMADVEQEFDSLLDESDSETAVQQLIEMINLFYSPLASTDQRNYPDRLYLWNQHRYSIGQPPGYIAMRSVGAHALQVYRPKLNPLYDEAVAVRRDHVLLGVRSWLPGDPALRIDWEMYRALWEAKRGKAIEVQPYSILRRLDLFLRSLSSEAGNWAAIETIHWGDYRKRRVITLKVNRDRAAYQGQ